MTETPDWENVPKQFSKNANTLLGDIQNASSLRALGNLGLKVNNLRLRGVINESEYARLRGDLVAYTEQLTRHEVSRLNSQSKVLIFHARHVNSLFLRDEELHHVARKVVEERLDEINEGDE